MGYVPTTKRDFYNRMGWMVMECPEYRSPHNDAGVDVAFDEIDQSIAILYKRVDDPIGQQLLRMSAEARRLSEAASAISENNDERKKDVLTASQIFVDMERLMKGKELMYYSE